MSRRHHQHSHHLLHHLKWRTTRGKCQRSSSCIRGFKTIVDPKFTSSKHFIFHPIHYTHSLLFHHTLQCFPPFLHFHLYLGYTDVHGRGTHIQYLHGHRLKEGLILTYLKYNHVCGLFDWGSFHGYPFYLQLIHPYYY